MKSLHCLLLAGSALFAACAGSAEPSAIVYYRAPMPGIHTSGQPTEAQFANLQAAGISRVIQLRLATEKGTGWEEERAGELGLEFVRISVEGAKGLTRDNVDSFAAELARPTSGDTLVCCGSSNRVGALFALKAFWKDGKDAATAMQIGKDAGMTRLEPKVRELLQ